MSDEHEHVYAEDDLTLSERRRRFVKEYLQDLTATQAAKRAGYLGTKASERLMSVPLVRAAIRDELNQMCERLGFTADDIVRGFAQIAFGDCRSLFHSNGSGRLKKPSEWTQAEAAQVSSFVVTMRQFPDGTEEWTTKVQLADRLRRLGTCQRL